MIYRFETSPTRKGEKPKQYEIKQSASELIRGVILGGRGMMTSKSSGGSTASGGRVCGPSGCC